MAEAHNRRRSRSTDIPSDTHEQGSHGRGGAKSYIGKGNMAGGFAILAYPAEYRNSGMMTFIIDQEGLVLQKDLGADTANIAKAIDAFDPDDTWNPVE
jgi:hypothetical protein